MLLGEFRKLTENVSDDSELVLWVYFDILDEDLSVIKDVSEGITNFSLDITNWTEGKKALHFTCNAQKVYDDMNARIN